MSTVSRRKCMELRNRIYPEAQWPGELYEREIINAGGTDRVFVELGCARHAPSFDRIAPHYRYAFGIDLETVDQLPHSDRLLIQGDAHFLPMADQTVDTVAMIDVVEHLADPGLVFAECTRILKPGGRLIISTVNKYFPFILLGRLVPRGMRKTVNRLLTGTLDDDTFPAFYRANTANDLVRTARGVGMSPVWVRYVSHHPTYLLFSTMIYRLGVVFEQVIRRCDALQGIRHMIQAVFEVPRRADRYGSSRGDAEGGSAIECSAGGGTVAGGGYITRVTGLRITTRAVDQQVAMFQTLPGRAPCR